MTKKPSNLIFAKCRRCDPHGRGRKVGQYFGRAYTAAEWGSGAVCENCGFEMTPLFIERLAQ